MLDRHETSTHLEQGEKHGAESASLDASDIFYAQVIAEITDTKGIGMPKPNPQLTKAEEAGAEGMRSFEQGKIAEAETKYGIKK